MMPHLLYSHPSDNVAAAATLTVPSGTPAAMYPVANLVDLNPAKPCKLAETTGIFMWEFSGAQRVDLVAIIHHNLTAGLSVKIQANATDSWGAPTLDTTITIPSWWPDGMPVNPMKDLMGVAGYSTGGFKFWRLEVAGANANPIAIGEVILLDRIRRMTVNISWGLEPGEDRPVIEHKTDYLVSTIYSYGVSQRSLSAPLTTTDAGAVELWAWWRACGGRALPFLIERDGGTTNDCWLARFAPSMKIPQDFLNAHRCQLLIDEVGRGLPL